ncbi:MFS transporter, partial [Pseudomonas aeruginosa]|uniref:MFS transporter n=1 Tax=Pseudomonas aeruginosa TaxID=287 RepID=UPI0012663187
ALGQDMLGVGVGALTAFPLSGFLVQRIGSRSVVIGGCLIMLLVFPLLGLSQGWWQLALAFYVLGVSFAGMDVAMNIQAVEVERLLGKPCMSMLHGMYSLGCLVGALSAAALAGLTPFWHFLILTALGLLSLPFFVRALLPPDPSKAGARKGGGFTLPPRALLGLGLLILCAFVSEGGVADWSALFLHSVLDASERVAALGFAAFSAAMVVGRLFGDRLRGRIDDAPLLRGLGSLATLGMLVALFSPWPALSIAGFGVVGLGLSVMVPIVISAAGNQPGIDPVIGVAAVSTVGYGGLLMGPPLIGLLAHEIGLRWALLVLVGLCLLLALRADLVRRRPRSA